MSKGLCSTQKKTSADDAADADNGGQHNVVGALSGVQGHSRDHLGMAILQPTVESAVRADELLLDVLVDRLFLVVLGHCC